MRSSINQPTIGITTSYDQEKGKLKLNKDYVEAIRACGGLPFILPHVSITKGDIKVILDRIDGLLLTGGWDVDPHHFGQEPRYKLRGIDPARDLFEIELVKIALKVGKPLFGICRGIQVLNIAAGGSIYQDIEGELEDTLRHFQDGPRWWPTHEVVIEPETTLYGIIGKRKLRVNSFHHQAIKKLAPNFKGSAQATDGIIEAIEKPGGKFPLGVQWHPETMWTRYPVFKKLFAHFVKAAGGVYKTSEQKREMK